MVKALVISKISYRFVVVLTFLILSVFSCKKIQLERPFAQLSTYLFSLDSEGVEVRATVDFRPAGDPIIEYGFVYEPYVNTVDVLPNSIRGAVYLPISDPLDGNQFSLRIEEGLDKGTTYFVRSYLRSEEWLAHGTEVLFTLE